MQLATLHKPAFRVQNTKKGEKKQTTTPGVRNTVRASPCQVFAGRGWLRNPGLPRGRPCSIGSARPLSAASPRSSSRRAVVPKNLALAVLRAQLSSAPASRPPHADVAPAALVPQRPGAERSGDAQRSRSPLPEARLPPGCGQTPPGTPPRAERGRSRSISPRAAVRSRPHRGSATGSGRTPLPTAPSSTRLCGAGPHCSRLSPPQ